MLRTQKSRNLDRSNRSDQQSVDAQRMPRSGFDLSYNSRSDFILGRLHVSGYHHTMPGDTFRGSNSGSFIFNELSVPVVSKVEVSQHNFYIPYRSLDTTFQKAFAPGKYNDMSIDWHAPHFSLKDIASLLFDNQFFNGTNLVVDYSSDFKYITLRNLDTETFASVNDLVGIQKFNIVYTSSFSNNLYLGDVRLEIYNLLSKISLDNFVINVVPGDTPIQFLHTSIDRPTSLIDFRSLMLFLYDSYFRYFVGEGSLLDSFGYNIIQRTDILSELSSNWLVKTADNTEFADSPDLFLDLANSLSDVVQNEYALRAYYAIWYEYYRDVNLEPISDNLPDYHSFGSTSVIKQNLFMLIVRPRCWQHDMYVGSLPDDPMRHVLAPIFVTSDSPSSRKTFGISVGNNNYLDAVPPSDTTSGVKSQVIRWLDPVSNSERTLTVPVPSLVNDSLNNLTNELSNNTYLTLQGLRQSQALERVLKRNFYFGDEYKDRMLAHYGSVVSDNRVNRPELLSSSVNDIQVSQEIANVGTDYSAVGSRVAVASAQSDGDFYSFYSEEFGIVINMISFMPIAQYNGISPHNLLDKVNDYPLPEFAQQFSEASRVIEISRSAIVKNDENDFRSYLFGHHAYAHAYRGRVDEVHGSFLSTKSSYSFARFFGMTENSVPKLNYSFVHCMPSLDMFVNKVRADGQLYGFVEHQFLVERPLPDPAEVI